MHTMKDYKYINYKWEHYTYVSYKQTGSQTSVVDLKCPHYNTDVQEVFFYCFSHYIIDFMLLKTLRSHMVVKI